MVIAAKFSGTCSACGSAVTPGERIHWTRGSRRVSHVTCPTQAGLDTVAADAVRIADGWRDCGSCAAHIIKGESYVPGAYPRKDRHVTCPTPCADGCGAARPKAGPAVTYFNTWSRSERLWHPEEQPGVYAFARVEAGAEYPTYPTLADGTQMHLNYGTIAGPCNSAAEAYTSLDSWERKWPELAGQMAVYKVPCLFSDASTWVPVERP